MMSDEIDYKTIYQIVSTLIGNVYPAGNTSIDNERKRNLNKHIQVMNMLINDVLLNIDYKNDYRASMKEIGQRSDVALKQLVKGLDEALEGTE